MPSTSGYFSTQKIIFFTVSVCLCVIMILYYISTEGVSHRFLDLLPKFIAGNGTNMSSLCNCTTCTSVLQNHDMTPAGISFANSKLLKVPDYADLTFLNTCSVTGRRATLFPVLKWWIEFASKHGIVWWLRDGTLIGAARHQDMVPWDGDMDLAVMQQYESTIRNMSTPRSALNASKINMVTRPGPHCPYNGMRESCKGKRVTSQVDGCAFCGPLARIFYTPGTRVDLYLSDIEFDENGIIRMFDESHFEYLTKHPLHPIDWYFPLRNCSFMGLTVLCPRKTELVLRNYYGNYSSKYVCKNKKWVKK